MTGDTEEPEPKDPSRVEANPARRFFVGMLVKDIELLPAILDLVDNSVDGAKRLLADQAAAAGDDVDPSTLRMDAMWVKIVFDGERFEITDNCGGIPLDVARNYAFRFGRPEQFDSFTGEVGQFGVGMKRALFKLGAGFSVTSVSQNDSFTLPVNVTKWVDEPDPDWAFSLSDFEEGVDNDPSLRGTHIEVKPLHASIGRQTSGPEFEGRLLNELRLRHGNAIGRGLRISVNGNLVHHFEPTLLVGAEFAPLHVVREIPVEPGSRVTITMSLYAGIVRTNEDDEDLDVGEAERFRGRPEAGWYLYCNDRLLIAADRTRLTGWGAAAAGYHPQYRQFRGYVLLNGDAEYMPWTTTKTSVDEDSFVFRTVQTEMFDALQKVQAILNRLKSEAGGAEDYERPGVRAMESARPAALSRIAVSERFVIPKKPARPPADYKNISYRVPKSDFDSVASEFQTTSGSEVGRRTFEFFLKTQVDDE